MMMTMMMIHHYFEYLSDSAESVKYPLFLTSTKSAIS